MATRISIVLAAFMFLGACILIARAPAAVLRQRQQNWGVTILPGDVLFQDLRCGERCELIRQVTGSRYTHVGIVLQEGGELRVWEAFAPVGPTPLVEWVRRGLHEQVAIYRLHKDLRDKLPEIAAAVRAQAGRPYDGDYQWDDERIYCSELIAKAINNVMHREAFAPHPVGPLGPHAARIEKLSAGRLTPATIVVTPIDLARSPLLERLVDELQR